jgi:hypothetical protein
MAFPDEPEALGAPAEPLDPQLAAQREADGMPDADAAAPAPPPAAVEYGQQDNLAATLPPEYLKHVGSLVLDQAIRDKKSMKGWLDKAAFFQKLHNGDIAESIPDQPNITPVHYPFFKRGVRMFHSKLFPALFPADGEVVAFKVRSPHLEELAFKCSAHMNQVLKNECIEYEPSHDRASTQFLVQGCFFEGWTWNPLLGRPSNEICQADDFWISYKAKDDRPDMANVPRKTWRLYYEQHELEELEANGYYVGVTQGDDPLFDPETSYNEAGAPNTGVISTRGDGIDDKPVRDVQDSFTGVEEPTDDPEAPRQVLEQDRMLRLPGEKRQRAVTVCIDKETCKVLRLVLREQDDRADKQRWKRETAKAESQFATATAQFNSDMQAFQASTQPTEKMDPMTGQVVLLPPTAQPGALPPEPPQPPPPVAPPKRVPWHRWVKYDCQINTAGVLGLGLGQDIGGHNKIADMIGTRAVSNMTLTMSPTGLISRQMRMARGEITLTLGKFNEVNLSAAEVERGAGMHQIQFPPVAPDWYKAVDQQDKSCQEVTAFDVVMGAEGKSGETATENENRSSASTSNISVVGGRYNRSRAYSLRNLAYIYSQTLPDDGVVVYVATESLPPPPPAAPMMGPPGQDSTFDPNAQPMGQPDMAAPPGMAPPPMLPTPPPPPKLTPLVVTREDYEQILDELEVTFTCDPQMESQAVKERRAMKLFQLAMQIATTPMDPTGPMLDPVTNRMLMRGVAGKVLEAVGAKEFKQLLEAAPMPAPPPPMMGPPGGMNGEGQGEGGPGVEGVPGQQDGQAPSGGPAGAPQ